MYRKFDEVFAEATANDITRVFDYVAVEHDSIGYMMDFLDEMGIPYEHWTDLPDDECHDQIRLAYRHAYADWVKATFDMAAKLAQDIVWEGYI